MHHGAYAHLNTSFSRKSENTWWFFRCYKVKFSQQKKKKKKEKTPAGHISLIFFFYPLFPAVFTALQMLRVKAYLKAIKKLQIVK